MVCRIMVCQKTKDRRTTLLLVFYVMFNQEREFKKLPQWCLYGHQEDHKKDDGSIFHQYKFTLFGSAAS